MRLKQCLDSEEVVDRFWREKVVDRERRWITVSPYAMVGAEHLNRIDEIPQRLCDMAHSTAEYCSHIDHFNEGIPYCPVALIY